MGWQERLLQDVAVVGNRTANSGPRDPWVGVLLRVHPDLHAAVKNIAQARGISMQTYLRRLLVIAIAKETGQPLAPLIGKLSSVMVWGPRKPGQGQKETGAGFEGMCTHPGCNEIHWKM